MKNIIEAFRNEERLPYVVGIVQIVGFSGIFLLDATESLIKSLDGTLLLFALIALCVSIIAILVVPILFIVKAYRFDRVRSKEKKDEREICNEYVVANAGYKVAMYGLLVIVFFGADSNMVIDPYEIVLLILLLMILGVRLYKRVKIEGEV